MQSTGYLETKSRRPGAVAAVIAVHAAGIGALFMIAPTVYERIEKPLEGYNVPKTLVPPDVVEDPASKTKAKTALPVDHIDHVMKTTPTDRKSVV